MIFEYTKSFGPLIKMITVMFLDMLNFFLLWGIIMIFFLCIGMLLFIDTNEFKTFQNALVFLAEAAIGGFDTSVFSKPMKYPYCICDGTCVDPSGLTEC